MSEKRTVVATEFVEKAGETNGKAWTRYGLKDANGGRLIQFGEVLGFVAREWEEAA